MLGKACSVSSLSIQLSLLFSLDNNWFQVFSQSLPKFKILDLRCSFYKFCFISTLHFCSCISRKFSLCSFYKFCFDGTDTTLGQQIQHCPWIWWKWDVNVVSRGGRTGVATLERVCRVLVIQNILTCCAPDMWLWSIHVVFCYVSMQSLSSCLSWN